MLVIACLSMWKIEEVPRSSCASCTFFVQIKRQACFNFEYAFAGVGERVFEPPRAVEDGRKSAAKSPRCAASAVTRLSSASRPYSLFHAALAFAATLRLARRFVLQRIRPPLPATYHQAGLSRIPACQWAFRARASSGNSSQAIFRQRPPSFISPLAHRKAARRPIQGKWARCKIPHFRPVFASFSSKPPVNAPF
jgi:hypothetical protein